MNQEKIIGFDPKKEENFLRRLDLDLRERNLKQELKTQLAEDFGMVEFTIKYKFNDQGKMVDLLSGIGVVEITSRGGPKYKRETESIKKIETGLRNNPEQTWIGFSPKNEELGYSQNYVDFWRVVNGRVVWNRLSVKNDFQQMNEIRHFLSGEEKVKDKMEILGSPIAIEGLKLAELFDYFRLSEMKSSVDFDQIEKVVDDFLADFNNDFGDELFNRSWLIRRLYSACHDFLSGKNMENFDVGNYMYGQMIGVRKENSYGCSATTTVGEFGEKTGYFISNDGKVSYGEIPEGYKECKKCGCWYGGEKCSFC